MQTYFSTFISGFQIVIEKLLKENIRDVEIVSVLDGVVIYKTLESIEKIRGLRFFNNSFLLLHQVDTTPEDSTASIVKRLYLTVDLYETLFILFNNKSHTFRIFISKENELTSINREIMTKIEGAISRKTEWTVNREKADYEFWFYLRSEGQAYLGVRLTGMNDKEKKEYAKGELKTELAYLLNALSEPKKNETFMDPFAGSGALAFERAKSFSFLKIIVSDKDEKLKSHLVRTANEFKGIEVRQLDGLYMPTVPSETIDTIITDPPWGIFNQRHDDFTSFYVEMLKEFERVLVQKGVVIVLTSKKEEFEQALKSNNKKLGMVEKYDILVSGKKAAVYKLKKSSETPS